MGREPDCSRASGGAPACGQPGCRDRPEAEPRPCGSPRPPRAMPPGRLRSPPAAPGPRSRASVPDALPAAARRAGRRSWRRTRSGPCPRRRRPAAGRRPDPCRARWRHSIAATSAAPKGRRSPSWPPAVPPAWSTLRSASWRYPVPPAFGSPLRCLSEASIPPIAFSRHCSSRKISTPNWRDRSCTGSRHAKAAERPHACAPPSIAGQVPAGLPAKPGLGKTWTSQARPHLPQAHQQQLSSQNYRSCSGPPWTLRLSQFCVQGNRVRLTARYAHLARDTVKASRRAHRSQHRPRSRLCARNSAASESPTDRNGLYRGTDPMDPRNPPASKSEYR